MSINDPCPFCGKFYWEVNEIESRQDSARNQLETIYKIAINLRCYDAAYIMFELLKKHPKED
jgi:hypothetical protein